ncbi:MAG: glycoside hydrolase family 3 [Catenulispora sp.]|nr:glycoside hydrolase family 3 [Catenulispora sp.]NUR60057.1 glycoside hydrolase family 3 [Catenulispora sp.]
MATPIPRARLDRARGGALALAAAALFLASTTTPAAAAAPAAPAPPTAGSTACPWVGSSAPIPQRVSQLLSHMSLTQEVTLLTGSTGSNYIGFTPAIGSLCIPAMNLNDNPNGVGWMTGVTQFPTAVDVAATWDTTAEQRYGQTIGAEQAAKGATIDFGPMVNIVRDPRFGRNYETLGEDPYLSGQLGASNIRGVQSTGVMAQVKHLAAYNQDVNRNTVSAQVDDRTEQEIYLPAFQAAVQQGAVSSVMCATNFVNGVAACQNPHLLTSVLRQQFGFTGFVTSDWGSIYPTNSLDATVRAAQAGLNQDMPGSDGDYGSQLVGAVNGGSVPKSTVDNLVSQVLTEMFAFGLFDKPTSGSTDQTATSPNHVTTARGLAQEGTVLLKNASGVLPFGSAVSSIAVIGADASTKPITQGNPNASGYVTSSGTVTPLQGITARANTSGVKVGYDDGTNSSTAASLAASSSVAVVFVGKSEGENDDQANIDLAASDNALISSVAAANPHTVVVLNTGSAVTMPWLNSVAGVFEAWYPGQEDGNAIAGLLFGDVNPSGHLPVTFPASLSQVPAPTAAQWPGTSTVPGCTQPTCVQYSEGLGVGYRWYDSQNIAPLFEFGFGLSYTSFAFSNLSISPLIKGGASTVTATVTNTGTRSGADVAQLYVTAPSAVGEPPKQLKGFARVDLAPGQSTTVTLPLTETDLHYWNTGGNGWATATGGYTISVGDSSRNLPLSGSLTVTTAQLGQPVTIANPGPQEGVAGAGASVTVTAADTTAGQSPSYTATGLPSGTAINPGTGAITGTPTTAGTSTVTVKAADATGAFATTSFTWTVTPAGSGIPTTSLVGYQGLCLDVFAARSADGTPAQVYTCNGTDAQRWTAEPDGSVRTMGKCLDAAAGGTANGTNVDLSTCTGTGAQQWAPQTNGTLLNTASGRCLTDPNSGPAGTHVQLSDCTGAANQVWTPAASRTGPVPGYQGLCMDVRYANSADRTPVQVYTCNGTNAQQWTVGTNSTIQALGKCLDVNAAGTGNGTVVQLYTCNGTVAQNWRPQPDGSLLNPNSGRCLDDAANGGSGTQLQIWDCNGGANQKWVLP